MSFGTAATDVIVNSSEKSDEAVLKSAGASLGIDDVAGARTVAGRSAVRGVLALGVWR